MHQLTASFSFALSVMPGPPSEEHCYADIEAAYDYLRKELHVPAQNIVLYGRSLGSGPSTHLAAQTALIAKEGAEYGSEDGPVGGLILHAPFLSVFRVVLDTGCTLIGDKFPNVDIIPLVRSPTILIHGTSDQIVPFNHSERLYESIPKEYRARPLYIEGMSHNNVHSQVRPMFVDRLCEYLEQHIWPSAVVRQRGSQSSSSPPNSSKVRKRVWKIVDATRNEEDDASEQLDLAV
jgi:abhydrolase domain-containing protein 17